MSDKTVRVLHVIAHMEKGGAERQMCLLTEASRHTHVIAVLAGNERASDSTVELLPDLSFMPTIKRIRALLKQHDIDVLHTWVPERLTVPATIAARLEGCPVLAGDRRKPRSYGYYALRDRLYYLPYLLADRIVPNYPILPKPVSLSKWLGFRRKTEVIPNGIPRTGTPGPLTAVPDRILFVGRLVEQKRVSLLLRALPALMQTAGIRGLDIVGEGPDRESLERLASEKGVSDHVTFHGARFDWHGAFSPSTHIVALPSASEGMSNTVFEAIDHGYLPVVSDSAEMQALFEGFASTPWFFDLDSDLGIVNQIIDLRSKTHVELQQIVSDLCDGLGQFSVAEMARRYDVLYDHLAAGRKRPMP